MTLEQWLKAAWEHGCDPDEMCRMADVFTGVLAAPEQPQQGDPARVKQCLARGLCEV